MAAEMSEYQEGSEARFGKTAERLDAAFGHINTNDPQPTILAPGRI